MPKEGEGMVTPKPTAPMPAGTDWDRMSDPDVACLQADLEAAKAFDEGSERRRRRRRSIKKNLPV